MCEIKANSYHSHLQRRKRGPWGSSRQFVAPFLPSLLSSALLLSLTFSTFPFIFSFYYCSLILPLMCHHAKELVIVAAEPVKSTKVPLFTEREWGACLIMGREQG